MSAHVPVPVPSTEATLQPSLLPRPEITHVVFDFDGTLSWVRHGWPAIMRSVFACHWKSLPNETEEQRDALFDSMILGLNGRPTIVQMEHFARHLAERQVHRVPESLRVEFQTQLDTAISQRLQAIRSGVAAPDHFVVHGARAVLEDLSARGLRLYVLSSTIEHRVKEEAEALGLSLFFPGTIHGSGHDPSRFSKMEVFQRILDQEGIAGKNLLSFGDGPVEIECTKRLGGTAIAICSDETHNGSGLMDPTKHAQLVHAGADAALPDFRDVPAFIRYLLQK